MTGAPSDAAPPGTRHAIAPPIEAALRRATRGRSGRSLAPTSGVRSRARPALFGVVSGYLDCVPQHAGSGDRRTRNVRSRRSELALSVGFAIWARSDPGPGCEVARTGQLLALLAEHRTAGFTASADVDADGLLAAFHRVACVAAVPAAGAAIIACLTMDPTRLGAMSGRATIAHRRCTRVPRGGSENHHAVKGGCGMDLHDNRARVALVLAAAAFTFGAAACGDDDDEGAATTAGGATETTAGAATETTAGATDASGATDGEASVEAFCQAELEAEAAAQSEDPSTAEPAFEAFVAAAPDDIRDATEALVAAAQAGDTEGPEFSEPYGEVVQYMKDNCGYTELDVTAADYSFTGVPSEVDAGGVIVTMENTGTELHEIVLWRINDDTTESAEELLAIEDDEELLTKVTPSGAAFAFPGDTAFGTGDLEPGNYLAVCQIPEGLTPDVAEQFPGPEATAAPGSTLPELGPPHHTLGMVAEFTVT